jgi:hypothetical protein
VFKLALARFQDSGVVVPSPCDYQQIKPVVPGPVHTLSPAFEADRDPFWEKKTPPTPGPGAYDLLPLEKDNAHSRHQGATSVFASRTERLTLPESEAPPVGSYDLSAVVVDTRIPTAIKRKDKRRQTSWTRTGLEESPSPVRYTLTTDKKVKGGVMNTKAHQCYPASDDQTLAFCTPHSNFIKRTYSRKYFHVNREVC